MRFGSDKHDDENNDENTTGRVTTMQRNKEQREKLNKLYNGLAEAVASGNVDFEGSTDGVSAALAALRGIGEWTAQYVALRALGQPDAFPASDLVLRRIAAGSGAPLSASELQATAEAWRPWRGYAAMHLWRAAADRHVAATNNASRSPRV